jgi:hypothetical protein
MTVENITELLGKTVVRIDGLKIGSEGIAFLTTDEDVVTFSHTQSCCEGVYVEDIVGDTDDLIGTPLVEASECSSDNEPSLASILASIPCQEDVLWTFYRFSTVKGTVTVRWLGEGNGCYAIDVDRRARKVEDIVADLPTCLYCDRANERKFKCPHCGQVESWDMVSVYHKERYQRDCAPKASATDSSIEVPGPLTEPVRSLQSPVGPTGPTGPSRLLAPTPQIG